MTQSPTKAVSIFYPFGEDGSGVEAHRLGLIYGLSRITKVYSRNQFSRWGCVLFLFDAIRGRRLYLRMNILCANFNCVLWLLVVFRRKYTLEINAPATEDGSSFERYKTTAQNAQLIVSISEVLARYVTPLNPACLVVPNGGRDYPTTLYQTSSYDNPHFLSFFNSHWPWQSIESINRVAAKLEQWDYALMLIDVNGDLQLPNMPSNVLISGKLSSSAYENALRHAAGFLLEYEILQDPEIGFYGDSLRFRDFWNTQKPIVLQGPKMGWAPQPQTSDVGVFTVEELEQMDSRIQFTYTRRCYTWAHAAQLIHSRWNENDCE